jgi:hypothetical protein
LCWSICAIIAMIDIISLAPAHLMLVGYRVCIVALTHGRGQLLRRVWLRAATVTDPAQGLADIASYHCLRTIAIAMINAVAEMSASCRLVGWRTSIISWSRRRIGFGRRVWLRVLAGDAISHELPRVVVALVILILGCFREAVALR